MQVTWLMPPPITAARISAAVPRLIGGGPLHGKVHSVYRSVVNVTTADGLLAIADPALGGLPNGISVDLGADFRAIGLRLGMPVVVSRTTAAVPDVQLQIDIGSAARWSPTIGSRPEGDGRPIARWRARSGAVWTMAGVRGAANGFGPLLRREASRSRGLDVAGRASASIADLCRSLRHHDRVGSVRAARGLVGLGEGLTPSGDDFLAGFVAALWTLGSPDAGLLADAIVDRDERTTMVSGTLLQHAAKGEFAERIHELMGALLDIDDVGIAESIERAVAWGASSGTDCLLGALVGLDLVTETSAGVA